MRLFSRRARRFLALDSAVTLDEADKVEEAANNLQFLAEEALTAGAEIAIQQGQVQSLMRDVITIVKSIPHTTRPWREFFERTRVTLPLGLRMMQKGQVSKGLTRLWQRIAINLEYYQGNYGIIMVCVFLMACYIYSSILILGILWLGGVKVARKTITTPVQITSDIHLSKEKAVKLINMAGGLLFYATSGMACLYGFLISSIVILVHAIFHKPTVEATMTNSASRAAGKKSIVDIIGSVDDLSIYDDQFPPW
ncbi:PRA1 family protein-domain-containing protein [Polychytrium aggregatum]|uniref:PRA1 family protein-domain-containing protein n=1 Tax=Polychytrium aggregatum TaxID=110093 RepID=UPI0022FE0486|nr:PRA1 family protein-domain-containing protein [Polychytrium aggregatum]KAI9205869.1 PRA1 family protein-domain-containing protein [Polychytrium aggregatum]